MSDSAISQRVGNGKTVLRSRPVGYLLAALCIIALPLIFNDTYWRTNLTICAINVLLALGLDFILGYTGQLNLGHSAFYGLGAYVSTLLIVKLGIPFWAAFVAGVAFAGLAGMFLSLFAVRLRGHYLAIASLGFAVIIYQILLNWISLTQGPLGIYGISPPPAIVVGGTVIADFRNLTAFFYLVSGSHCSSTCCSINWSALRLGKRSLPSARTRSPLPRSASMARRGKCSRSAWAQRLPAPQAASMRVSSARWCPTRST
jgi:ABC-type branched-subunit amino acid transport system permease subunit